MSACPIDHLLDMPMFYKHVFRGVALVTVPRPLLSEHYQDINNVIMPICFCTISGMVWAGHACAVCRPSYVRFYKHVIGAWPL